MTTEQLPHAEQLPKMSVDTDVSGVINPPPAQTTAGRAYRWSFISLAVRVVVQAVSGIVIARQIGPEKFGSGMLIVSIYGVASALVQAGVNGSLVIRRLIPRGYFLGTVAINTVVGIVTAAAMVFAGLLSNDSSMRIGFLVAAAGCLVQIVTGPALALSIRGLRFNRISLGEITGAIVGTTVAIAISSTSGSLVSLPIQMVLIDVGICVFVARSLFSTPEPLSEVKSTDVGYKYGAQSAANNVVSTGARNADNYLVAGFLGHTALGLYVLAYRLMMLPIQNISMVLTRVLVPRLRHLAAEASSVVGEIRKLSLAIALPVGAITGASVPLIPHLMTLVFGHQYAGAIAPTQILLLAAFPQCCSNVASCVLAATGRARTQLILTSIGLGFAVLAVIIGQAWGIKGVTAVYALLSVVLAVLSVRALKQYELSPAAPFLEALRYYLIVAAGSAAIAVVFRLVTPDLGLLPTMAELGLAAIVGGLAAQLTYPRAAKTSVAFWRSVAQGQT
jgi:teichuronic acid exporter